MVMQNKEGAAHWAKKATIDHVTTMVAMSKNILFPGHHHLPTTGADDPRWRLANNKSVGSVSVSVSVRVRCRIQNWSKRNGTGRQHWCLGPGNKTFLEVASIVVTWWIVAFFTQWLLPTLGAGWKLSGTICSCD